LLDENITAEDTLIPTLVFAKIAGGSPEYAAVVKDKEQASGLEIVRLMHALTIGLHSARRRLRSMPKHSRIMCGRTGTAVGNSCALFMACLYYGYGLLR
jgi:hypothetical protein